MQLEAMTCNNCGAPLQVPAGANFVTCAHCGSQLAVRRTDTVAYTEVLAGLDRRTTQVEADLHRIQLRDDLDQLDRDWTTARQRYLIRSRNGAVEPTRIAAYLYIGVSVLLGVFIVVIFIATRPPPEVQGWFLLMAVFTLVLGFLSAENMLRKTRRYEQAYHAYLARRKALTRQYQNTGQ